MKVVKGLILFLIGLFLINLKVSGATGTYGICYGENLLDASGYCRLASPVSNIYSVRYTSLEHRTAYNDGTSPARSKFFGTVSGKEETLFCIDPNYSSPNSSYPFSRALNLKSDYDKSIAKVYQMYINDTVYLMNQTGVSFANASSNYMQAANVAMRALTKKYGNDLVGKKTNYFDNIVNQFEGRTASNPKLVEGTEGYNLVKRYYCSANAITANSVSHCTNLAGVSKADVVDYKFTLNFMPEETEDINISTDKFEKIISIKISGIQKLKNGYESYKNTNPLFYITDIKCENDKLACTPIITDITTKNLISESQGDNYILKVKISGNKADFKNEASTDISIKYKYHHILNVENLAVLRTHLTEQKTQRLIALMPDREQELSQSIKINLPSMCEVREENGITSYYFGGTKVNELEYIRKGCCNVKPNKLKENAAINLYMATCATEDFVSLDTQCDNDSDNPSKSVLEQKDIDIIMNLVNNTEKNINSYSTSDYNALMAKTNNYRDDVYLEELIAKDNNYCKLYTSESQVIEFPGTAEATSGRFFIFKEGQQPKVEGEIMLNFHTNYDLWKKDYEAAIKKEKDAYTDWQKGEALMNAINKLSTCEILRDDEGPIRCGCCGPFEPGPRPCAGGCYIDSTYRDGGTYYALPNRASFFDANGNDLSTSTYSASRSCGCGGITYTTPYRYESLSTLKSRYKTAVTNRQTLETYKYQCEEKSKLAKNWNYYLEPDLYFNYKQEYYKDNKMVHTSLDKPIELEVSYNKEKYWPNVSTPVKQIAGTETKQTDLDETFTISYGKTDDPYLSETESFDPTTDYQIGYEQTLYYKPTVKYYSLLPDGYYTTNVTKYQSESAIDVGYVFNVEITNYTNQYLTWFSIKNIGHLMQNPSRYSKLKSNLQKAMDKAINEIDDQTILKIYNDEQLDSFSFNNICYYNNEQILYQPECPTCTDFSPQYFTRTVAKENMFPNEGVGGRLTGANWASTKGRALEAEIARNSDLIYGDIDGSQGFLDASIRLTPAKMNEINNNYNKGKTYSDFNLSCNESGKECISLLLTELVKDSPENRAILENSRANGWPYFVDGKWSKGSIASLLKNGYPEETAGLTDWP